MIHLHLHSTYSILDGLGKVADIVARAKELGAPAVAITDHASISALTDFMTECAKAEIKPIVGCEFYWVDSIEGVKGEDRRHLTVWAKNWNGVKSIMKQLSKANKQFYNRPRLSWEQCLEFEDCIIGTACSHGLLGRVDYDSALATLGEMYGRENVYLELMPHADFDETCSQSTANKRAVEMAERGFPLLATNDAHYVLKEDALTHEVLLAIQTGASWDDPKRFRFESGGIYMRSVAEMVEAYRSLGYLSDDSIRAALQGTVELAKKIDIVMPKFEVHLPSPYGDDETINESMFQTMVLGGWKGLSGGFGDKKQYLDRLTYEISVIKKLGFTKYFLVVHDIIKYARDNGIMVGPARGSAAGSLVCYLLGITQVDPMKHELYFERFLNPERIDLPDIDVDFQDNRRDEVFAYIKEKYGADYTGNINTFGKLTEKSAFRDVCRVFGVNQLQMNMLSKQIEDAESFDKVPELMSFAKHHPNIVTQTKKLAGVIRQTGVHACGYFISSEPLGDVAVIERRKDAEVVNWDMKQSEKFGLVKIDVLGLTTLTVLEMTKQLVKKRHGVDIDYTAIPLDDEKTLGMFHDGRTLGIFQFEGTQMASLLKTLGANDFETITATTALYRPGSLNSGQTEMYVKITKGDEYETYACEQLRPILGNTKGIMVYQEQIMRVFNELGGFTWAGADKMRKIIGKKLGKDEFEKHRENFVNGCTANGIEEVVSSSLFDKMVEFAEYSFNKSHAVAYTMISFWTMYVKTHYPVEFFTAQMTCLKEQDRLPLYVKEAASFGVAVNPPDINISDRHFQINEDGDIVAPLGIIKGLGEKAVDEILKARNSGDIKCFMDYKDFEAKIYKRVVNTRVVDALKRVGALDRLDKTEGIETDPEQRAKNLSELLPLYAAAPSIVKAPNFATAELEALNSEILLCSGEHKLPEMLARSAGNATIMVINNPVKNERQHLQSDGTKFLLQTLFANGIDHKNLLYYTGAVKCFHPTLASVPKDCQARCGEFLRREIRAVQPKLIICFAANAMKVFGVEEQMSKYNGQVIYSKEFDCYVLFSYSPQYAFFNEDKMPLFYANIEKVKEMMA